MIPDLRFVIGAVVSIALLTITAFGLGVAAYLRHQTKVGPLEASRLLAFGPSDRRLVGHNDPFAGLPVSPHGMRPSAEMPTVQAAQAVPAPAEAATTTSPGDPDTVDERAVVDPPLSPDEDPTLTATPPDADAAATAAAEPPGSEAPQAPTGQAGSQTHPPAASDENTPAAPSSASASLEPSSTAATPADTGSSTAAEPVEPTSVEAAPTEAASVVPALPETAPVEAAPTEAASVAPAAPETAPGAATPSGAVSDPEPVGSVTVAPANPVVAEPAAALPAGAVNQPKLHKAKAKTALPKAKAKAAALPKPKAKAASHKAKAKPRRQARTVPPNASTGYRVAPDGFFGAPMPRQTGQPKPMWSGN